MLHQLAQPIAAQLAQYLDIETSAVAKLLAPPTRPAGDLALPCFAFAKAAKKAPPQLAAELATVASAIDGVRAEAAGPFLNIYLAPRWLLGP